MPRVYNMNPRNRKVLISTRLDEDAYIEISNLAYSIRESHSYLYRELLRGAVKALELAKEDPQLLEGNPALIRIHESPRRDSRSDGISKKLQVHDVLARMVELEAEVRRLNEEGK